MSSDKHISLFRKLPGLLLLASLALGVNLPGSTSAQENRGASPAEKQQKSKVSSVRGQQAAATLGDHNVISDGIIPGDGIILGGGIIPGEGLLIIDGIILGDGFIPGDGIILGDRLRGTAILTQGDNTAPHERKGQ